MKTLVTIGWILFCLEVLLVVALLLQRNMGDDAAGRGLATGWGIVLAPVVLAAGGLLFWGSHGGPRIVLGAGILAVWSPVVFFAFSTAGGLVDKFDRSMGRAQYGRYDDPRLTKLARAVDRNDLAEFKRLLAAGPVDFAARDRRGRTLLGHAVTRAIEYLAPPERVDAVRLLLEAGAKPVDDAVAPERTSAEPDANHLLAVAIGTSGDNQLRVLDLLLGAGLATDGIDMDDHSVMFSTYMNREKFEVLARHGADFRVLDTRTDRAGWTTAMVWAQLGDWEIVEFLLDHGVPADQVAPDGRSLASILEEKRAGSADAGEAIPARLEALVRRVETKGAGPAGSR